MCGIVGHIGDLTKELATDAIESLWHRGPDYHRERRLSVAGQTVWMGHTRLSILDLSEAGAQPMASRDGRWLISFNGEIYNHLALRRELRGAFRGTCDTETLVEYIAQYGIEKTLPALNGMFAFAAVDTRDHVLYLARDPFGIKPLYFVKHNDTFSFASEIRALQALGVYDGSIDQRGLDAFLTLRFVPSPRTLAGNVSSVPPGTIYRYDIAARTLQPTTYITPTQGEFEGTFNEAVDAYHVELISAVRRQLLSDVPVGILLSGGVDSALLAGVARDLGRSLQTFTVGFGDRYAECEAEQAKRTSEALGLKHAEIIVGPEELLSTFEQAIGSIEQPVATTSVLPMWHLAKRAKQDVTVVLTGQGSDEPWGGYRRYQAEFLRESLPQALLRVLSPLSGNPFMPEPLSRGLRSMPVKDEAHRFTEAYSLFTAADRQKLTGRQSDGGAEESVSRWLHWLGDSAQRSAERMMRIDVRLNLSDDLLLYGDKISMAFSLEARVPMLDISLVRFVESLPLRFRASIRRTKILHKRVAEIVLPNTIVHRRKQGFQVPFGTWSRGPWRSWIEDRLMNPSARYLEIVDRSAVESLWKSHLTRTDQSKKVFALLMLAIWRDQVPTSIRSRDRPLHVAN